VSWETPESLASSSRVSNTSAEICGSVFLPGAVPPCSRCRSFALAASNGSSVITSSTRCIGVRLRTCRNLSDYAKGVLALALKPLVEEKAKANQSVRKGEQAGATLEKLPKLSPVNTREEIAAGAGLSGRTIDKIEKIEKTAAPALFAPYCQPLTVCLAPTAPNTAPSIPRTPPPQAGKPSPAARFVSPDCNTPLPCPPRLARHHPRTIYRPSRPTP
jgi:hypothetical protein